MKGIRTVAGLVLLVVVATLGYGYWFSLTHGTLSVWVRDVSDPKPVMDVRLSFLDREGRLLAEARGVPPYGTVSISAPAEYACHEIERQAPFSVDARERWAECFARQSRWVSTWIRNAAVVDLQTGACAIRGLPIGITEYSDWWMWWLPLPHAGGKPYRTFSVRIDFDRSRCTAAGVS